MKRTAKQMVELRTVGKKRELVIKESDLRNEFVMCDRGFE